MTAEMKTLSKYKNGTLEYQLVKTTLPGRPYLGLLQLDQATGEQLRGVVFKPEDLPRIREMLQETEDHLFIDHDLAKPGPGQESLL